MNLQDFNAKLSDFGLAKDGPMGDQTHVSTRVMGTYGYAAPEYVMTGETCDAKVQEHYCLSKNVLFIFCCARRYNMLILSKKVDLWCSGSH